MFGYALGYARSHAGSYANLSGGEQQAEFDRLAAAATYCEEIGLECHAGHGLTFDNVAPVAAIPQIVELNIGHFLIGEAIFGGLDSTVRRMRALMDKARAEPSGRKSA